MSLVKTILVTGGLGYIGSHTFVELFNKDYLKENKVKNEYDVVIVDDCSYSQKKFCYFRKNDWKKKYLFTKFQLCIKKI